MSSFYTASQNAVVANKERLPASYAVVRSDSPARSRPASDSQSYQVFHYVLLIYLFMYVTRLPELLPFLRIGLILQPILMVGLILTQRYRVLLDARAGRWLMGFTLWVAICVPFSSWPGGSAATLIKTLQSLFLTAFILAFVRSTRDVMRALTAVGFATGTIAS